MLVALLAASCGGGSEPAAPVTTTATLLAAGDIAECGDEGDEQTAEILAAHPDAAIATLGDNAY